MEKKYTDDGKKVVVIWNLNNQQKIVQEVFIKDNWDEIPSWENFVVTSLHDSPLVSWKEKELIKLEERYNKESIKYKDLINDWYKKYKRISEEFKLKYEYVAKYLKNIDENTFNLVSDFITWDIEYIVYENYTWVEIIKYDEWCLNDSFGSLRLLSLFWRDDWNMDFRINTYGDWSWSNITIYAFKKYEDALQKATNIFSEKKYITLRDIEAANKLWIKISESQINKYKEREKEAIEKSIQYCNKSLKELDARLENIDNLW
jgi:hypothetical protein